jgi:BCD family chlorophyll transporter-like MFS transporter
MFAVSTLNAAMTMPTTGTAGRGLALGAWGAAQATAGGLSIVVGGTLRDVISNFAMSGGLGEGLMNPALGYSVVYHIEIYLLFFTLIALGPLVRVRRMTSSTHGPIGLADFPT